MNLPALRQYIIERNTRETMFGSGDVINPDNPTFEQVEMLGLELDREMSPENLTCDGELSGQALDHKTAYLERVGREIDFILEL